MPDGDLPAAPDPARIALVQQSYARIASDVDFAARFYDRLFHLSPEVRPLFAADMAVQRQKLASTLTVVVRGLQDFEALRPTVEILGRAHVGFGVSEAHYASVGSALVWSLEAMAAGLSPAEREAWVYAYGFISTVMIRAARTPAPPGRS